MADNNIPDNTCRCKPDPCPRCEKRAYAAEQVLGAGFNWHKSCFNCYKCHKKLDSTTVAVHKDEIYCKTCHGANFGPKGYGFGGGAGALSRTQ
ncbi:cysteine and glycine-rich protein 1 [Nematostella vectensis]|nr:cysteine and glycine-rich protein 1 [Nematostella vectensis]